MFEIAPEITRYCRTCQGEQLFIQPACVDGPSTDEEWACEACGSAFIIDPALYRPTELTIAHAA